MQESTKIVFQWKDTHEGGGRTHSVTNWTDTQRGGRTHNVTQRTDTHKGGTHPQSYQTNGHTGGDAPPMLPNERSHEANCDIQAGMQTEG